MYKVYVIWQRKGGSEVIKDSRTSTPVREAAIAAFKYLRAQEYSAQHLLLLTCDREKVAVHRYGSQPGDPDYIDPDAL